MNQINRPTIKNRILSILQHITKTDVNYLLKGSFWLTLGQVLATASSLILSIVLAHTLPEEVYGNYKFILSLAGIISGLSLSGIGTTLIQSVAKGNEGTLYLAVKTQLKWSSVVSIVSIAMSIYYFAQDNIIIATSMLIVAMTVPITNSIGLYGAFLSGKKDFKRNTIYGTFSQLIVTFVIITIAISTHSVIALIFGYFVSGLVISLYLYKKTLSIYNPSKDNSDPSMIKYGTHLSAMGFIGTIANQLDKVLVFHSIGAAPLAVYAFASAIPEQIKGTLKNILNIGIPKFAQLDEITLRKSINDKVIRLTIFFFFLVMLYWFAALYIYNIFFPKYSDSIYYSQLYSLGLIVFPGISFYSAYFQLIKDTKTLYFLTVSGNVITILLSLILIPKYGILGATIENTLSWVCYLIIIMIIFPTMRLKKS